MLFKPIGDCPGREIIELLKAIRKLLLLCGPKAKALLRCKGKQLYGDSGLGLAPLSAQAPGGRRRRKEDELTDSSELKLSHFTFYAYPSSRTLIDLHFQSLVEACIFTYR
jgi:hypothetical protein